MPGVEPEDGDIDEALVRRHGWSVVGKHVHICIWKVNVSVDG